MNHLLLVHVCEYVCVWIFIPKKRQVVLTIWDWLHVPYIGNFSREFNFRWVRELPEIAKNTHSENKPYYTSSLRVLEIAKIGLRENLTRLPSVIFAKFSRREKFPIYGISSTVLNDCIHYYKGNVDYSQSLYSGRLPFCWIEKKLWLKVYNKYIFFFFRQAQMN